MKSEFKGKLLVDPETVPMIGFLEGKFGREFLAEYYRRMSDKYENNENLRVLNIQDGLVAGSNPFAVVLANEVLAQENLRTATQADLEKALKLRVLELRGTYEDTGLVLRSEGNPNSYLARDLTKQLRARNPEFQYPVLINLTDLELRVDSDSNYGLSFRLKEDARSIYAPVLNSPNDSRFNSSDVDESTGLPKIAVLKGNRTLYTRDSGLSRLYLCRSLNLGSASSLLADSGSDGRVVVVSDVATQKFSE